MLTFSRRLIELELAVLSNTGRVDATTLLLHDAADCPAASRLARAEAVLQMVVKKKDRQPQAPKLALAYVRRLIELELAALDDGPPA
jgi:hypothetical protein